eukprot:scaffold15773_cov72-Skeletonema_dohrnii-CCMP3373.AAC.1
MVDLVRIIIRYNTQSSSNCSTSQPLDGGDIALGMMTVEDCIYFQTSSVRGCRRESLSVRPSPFE